MSDYLQLTRQIDEQTKEGEEVSAPEKKGRGRGEKKGKGREKRHTIIEIIILLLFCILLHTSITILDKCSLMLHRSVRSHHTSGLVVPPHIFMFFLTFHISIQ